MKKAVMIPVMRNAALKRNDGRARSARRYLVVGLLTAAAAVYLFESTRIEYAAHAADTAVPRQANRGVAGRVEPPRVSGSSHRQLAFEVERGLVSGDAQQRETAFASVLPELLATSPESVPAMVARIEPGEARRELQAEVARQWIAQDSAAAIAWMHSLSDENEQRASAVAAMRRIAASSPARAIEVADKFGIGRDDGSLEHLVQIWASENPDEAQRWADSQPEGPATVQLRARIEHVRAQDAATEP